MAERKARVWRGWVWRFSADGPGGAFYDGQQGGTWRDFPFLYETRDDCTGDHSNGDGEAVRVEIREVLPKRNRRG